MVKANIEIAGKFFPMQIKLQDEEVVRRAGKAVNQMISDFQRELKLPDPHSALAMVSLDLATETLKNRQQMSDDYTRIDLALRELESLLAT